MATGGWVSIGVAFPPIFQPCCPHPSTLSVWSCAVRLHDENDELVAERGDARTQAKAVEDMSTKGRLTKLRPAIQIIVDREDAVVRAKQAARVGQS